MIQFSAREIFGDKQNIVSRRKMWPHSDGLIWHLLLQTESVGPWGCQERRDRGVIESSSLDLIGK